MNTAQGASAAMIGWCSLVERVVGGVDGGGGGCWLAHGLGWLSVRHCLISFVWTGTMLDEQKVFDRAPPVILPILHANVYQNPTTEQ